MSRRETLSAVNEKRKEKKTKVLHRYCKSVDDERKGLSTRKKLQIAKKSWIKQRIKYIQTKQIKKENEQKKQSKKNNKTNITATSTFQTIPHFCTSP